MVIDVEVHLLHPEACQHDFLVGSDEPVRKAVHDHADFDCVRDILGLDALLDSMKRNKVTHSLIMGMSWRDPGILQDNNTYIESCIRAHTECLKGCYIPFLGDIATAISQIEQLDTSIFRGVKILPAWQGVRIDDDELTPVLQLIQERDLFLMVHTDHLTSSVDGDTPQRLFKVLQQFPDLKVLAPHMGGLLCMYQSLPKYWERLSKVFFITSVSATMHMVKAAVELNSQNILFGTDFPFNHCHDQSTQIQAIQGMGLDEQTCHNILSGNALRMGVFQ